MTSSTDLKALLERLRAATGPDEALAVAINEALDIASYITDDGDPTASIDASLALVERVLPETMWRLQSDPDSGDGFYCTFVTRTGARAGGDGATAQLAILTALLTALIAKDARQ